MMAEHESANNPDKSRFIDAKWEAWVRQHRQRNDVHADETQMHQPRPMLELPAKDPDIKRLAAGDVPLPDEAHQTFIDRQKSMYATDGAVIPGEPEEKMLESKPAQPCPKCWSRQWVRTSQNPTWSCYECPKADGLRITAREVSEWHIIRRPDDPIPEIHPRRTRRQDTFVKPPTIRKTPPRDRLEDIPPDVPYDDATITAWNGDGFVTFEKWRASMPIETEKKP